jgi:hypothetical protein
MLTARNQAFQTSQSRIPKLQADQMAARPKGMLSRRILISFPPSTMVVSALCAEVGLMESSNSMSASLVRPMMRSWRHGNFRPFFLQFRPK